MARRRYPAGSALGRLRSLPPAIGRRYALPGTRAPMEPVFAPQMLAPPPGAVPPVPEDDQAALAPFLTPTPAPGYLAVPQPSEPEYQPHGFLERWASATGGQNPFAGLPPYQGRNLGQGLAYGLLAGLGSGLYGSGVQGVSTRLATLKAAQTSAEEANKGLRSAYEDAEKRRLDTLDQIRQKQAEKALGVGPGQGEGGGETVDYYTVTGEDAAKLGRPDITPGMHVSPTVAKMLWPTKFPTADQELMRQDSKAVAFGIERGLGPPTNLGRDPRSVYAELARDGYNWGRALSEWNAVQAWIRQRNGRLPQQQIQSTYTLEQGLDQLDGMVAQLRSMVGAPNWTRMARLNLGLTKDWNLYGPEAGDLARQIISLMSDLQPEAANIYQAGGVPTEQAMKLAQKSLSLDIPLGQVPGQTKIARMQTMYRANAIRASGPQTPWNVSIPMTPGTLAMPTPQPSYFGGQPQNFGGPPPQVTTDEESAGDIMRKRRVGMPVPGADPLENLKKYERTPR